MTGSSLESSDLSSSEDFVSCSSISSFPNNEHFLDNKKTKSEHTNSKFEPTELMYVSDSYSESKLPECMNINGSSKTKTSKRAFLESDSTIQDNKNSDEIEQIPIQQEIFLRFQPLCTPEDEIAILEGMMKFSRVVKLTTTGVKDFYSFIKDSLACKLSCYQLSSKLSKLKQICISLVYVPTEDLSLHEQLLLNLGEKIWDDVKDKMRKRSENKLTCSFLLNTVIEMHSEKALEDFEKLDPRKAGAFERKIKKHKVSEMRYHMDDLKLSKSIYKWIKRAVR